MAQGAPVVTDTRYFQGRVGWAIEFPFRVEVRLGLRGPNAAPATTDPAAFHAGDPVLLDLLGGVVPEAAAGTTAPGATAATCCWSPVPRCSRRDRGRQSAAPAAAGPTACRTCLTRW